MENALLTAITLFLTVFFYLLGFWRGEKCYARRMRGQRVKVTPPKVSARKKPSGRSSAITEGFANMATGGAFSREQKNKEGIG